MNQSITKRLLRRIFAVMLGLTLATVNAHAADQKAGVFVIRGVTDQSATLELLQAHIKTELTALNQAIAIDAEQSPKSAASAFEHLIIQTHELTQSKSISIQLIRRSDGHLLHADVVQLPGHAETPPDGVRMVGANIARQLVRKLDKLNYDARIQRDAQWTSEPSPVVWHLENIDQCRQDFLVTSIEDGFPGTIAIMLEKSATSKYSVYRYIGRANLQRQTQWLRTLLRFEGVDSQAYKLFSSKNEIRIVFEDATALNPYVCAGSQR